MHGSGGIVLIAAVAVCASVTPAGAATPDEVAAVLERWDRDDHPDLRGVVVLRGGRRIAERYYNGAVPDELHDIRSAGKSVTALVTGIAVDRGAIHSLGDPVSRYWPASAGSAIGPVPLRDVLTMRSGLAAFDEDPASPGNEDRMDAAPDPAAFVRGVPRADSPGTRYRYNSVTAYVAGLAVAGATGSTMAEFAGQHLFAPLGIARWHWDADAAGMTKGQGNLRLTVRDLAVLGETVRNRGRYRGRQVVSARWIADMTAPHVTIAADDAYADTYGYFWYGKTHRVDGAAIDVSFASGNGGNKIYVVPACRLVIAVTSSAYGKGYGQRRSEAILKALLEAETTAGRCRTSSRR
ncbi:serine hydrolase domain-containing protein [Novosphingobium sp.]|jgi:CubicO group peptidase (beta-lactamase class C family)|uniref:serine hydrolase domain-containing protein n=1 Tax=Novosphingobium sp. TaxID=1874826 RepID=UPI002FDFA237